MAIPTLFNLSFVLLTTFQHMDLVKEDMAEKCKHLGVRTKLNSAQLAHSMYTKQFSKPCSSMKPGVTDA
jgi:hypothetical protein